MAGPTRQSLKTFVIPPGEAQVQYSADSLAFKVSNFERSAEGTLKSVIGPTPYEPLRNRIASSKTAVGQYNNNLGESQTPHSLFHASLLGGQVDMLVARVGSLIYRHAGWQRGWEIIEDNLSSEARPDYPDQYTVLNGNIIWTNGVDQARVIDADGSVALLGFTQVPSAPIGVGPVRKRDMQLGDEQYYPNHFGYSWNGRIGTPGDLLDGAEGAILTGTWYYYVQMEDDYGNLSATSSVSNPVQIQAMQASPYDPQNGYDAEEERWTVYDATIDDLTRQFLVQVSGDAPDHCMAIHIYRTPDTQHVDNTPRFVARVPNNREFMWPDNAADSELGAAMMETVPVPIFQHMCTHQGCLVVANVIGDAGIVRRSDIGFPGTFPKTSYVYPDSGGAEITGITSHNGTLLAFTEASVYAMADFSSPTPLSQGIGCVAPRSIKALPGGMLVWLGRDGFYAMTSQGIVRVSQPIDRTLRYYVNRGRMRMAVATIDAASGEYRCALAPAGEQKQTLLLCFDGQSWRRQDLSLDIKDMCATDDWRQYTLALGKEESSAAVTIGVRDGSTRIEAFVLGRASRDYTPPPRTIVYRSAWLRSDPVGITPINIRTMYISMLDAWDGDFTVRFYRNGSWAEFVSMSDVKAVGVDDGSNIVTDIAGSAVIGTAKTHDPRAVWRQVPVGIENATSWAFEIEATYPTRLNLGAFSFDVSVATNGSPRGRIPHRSDV